MTRSRPALLPICALLLALGLTPLAATAAGAAGADSTANSLRAGRWALRFGLTFSEDPLAEISAQRHLTDRSALQLQLGFGLSTSESQVAYLYQDIDTTNSSRDASGDDQTYFLSASYLYYPRPVGPVVPLLGLGPFASYSRSHDESFDVDESPYSQMSDTHDADRWDVGLLARLGFEWFFKRQLSLGVDYGLTAHYTHAVESIETAGWQGDLPVARTADYHSQGFHLNTTQLGFGMTYYF